MSDGLSDAARNERALDAVETACEALADALQDLTDRAFGIAPGALYFANRCLRRAGVELVDISKGRPK